MKIYFGHSRMSYGTEEEKRAIYLIADYYPNCELINPNTPEHQEGCTNSVRENSSPGEEMDYFLRLTDLCDIGCFYQHYKDGYWSAGSACEANYMFGCSKSILQVDIENDLIKPIRLKVQAFSFDQTYNMLVQSGKRPGELR